MSINRGNDMPETGARMQIMVGSRIIAGYCLNNECRSSAPVNRGEVYPGLGIMRGDDRRDYWFKAQEWFNE
jgi:hypothetical protein